MVEMLLKHVEQHTHARTVVHKLQLMRRKLVNHNGIGLDFLHDVEARDADVARQDGIAARGFQEMVNQTGRCAFAFRPRNAYGLIMELAEKQVGLRGDFHTFRVEILQGNPWRLDDDVVVVHRLKILTAKMFHAFHLVLVSHCDDGFRQILLYKAE